LGRVLRKAKDEGKPYHVFHFDGHGTYADLGGSGGFGGVNRNTFASQRPGQCGYLLFENPRQEENMELVVDLRPEDGGARPITFDLVPRAETEEQTGTFTLGIGPDFKFSSVNVTLAKAETTINLRRVFPVITADGIGESTARWVFASRPAHPLVGSQIVYAIVQLPPGVEAARVSLFLNAEMTTGFGPIKGLLPKIQECCYSIFGMFVWMWQLHQPIHLYATGLHLALPNFPMQKILPSFFPDHLI
jgi:hypothetical protein